MITSVSDIIIRRAQGEAGGEDYILKDQWVYQVEPLE